MSTNNNSSEAGSELSSEISIASIQNTLEEILIWSKIANIDKVQNALTLTLDTDEKKLVYHFSNGDNQDGIVQKAGVSGGTVSNYWRKWYKLGLMKKVPIRKGVFRYVKNFELEDFGIDLPKLPKSKDGNHSAQGRTSGSEEA